MDLEKIFIKNANPTKIGGQAVIEGVMMKGKTCSAVSIRKPDGEVKLKVDQLKKPSKLMKLPIVRGVVAFVDALLTGTKTLMYSAEVLEEAGGDIEKGKFDQWVENKFGDKGINFILYLSVTIAIIFSVGFFIILPTVALKLLEQTVESHIVLNLMEGAIRILLFVLYVTAISRLDDIKRVFQYHGAEHKTIHCFESGLDLTVENCKKFTVIHPRCGTSFMMFVMVISLLLFSFLGWPTLLVRIASRLLLVPVIAGLSYELLKVAGKSNSSFVKIVSYPGLLLQKLTTNEPDDDQIEIAISSMKAVLECDNNEKVEIEDIENENS